MYSFHMQTTQLLHHCCHATDEEYRVAADSLLPLCLWLGAELMYGFIEEMNEQQPEELLKQSDRLLTSTNSEFYPK
jgi:hypothetical protein